MENWGFRKFGQTYDSWPRDEKGEPIAPAFLERVSDLQLEAEMAVNMLKAYGVPVVCRYPNNGEFGQLILGVSGMGVDLYVPETMLEEAKDLLKAEVEEEENEVD